ncbi:IclR family transcriptional regulator [Parafrigoribacterium mesophilum]|uniref:IclR family transcriptional regulator n=1 Tax=Parafrigoribacterium mesophilum TaxID=433646 RepID=UPI0031FDF100
MQSVEHAIDVLQVLTEAPEGMGVSAIAERVGLSKATVHHLLGTLASRRFVVRDETGAQYRLSWGVYELGAAVVRRIDLTRVARHYLDRLAAQTGESVLLGMLDGDSVLYLDRGEARSGFRVVANAGRRCALHSTASGKVLLAFTQDPQVLQRVVARPLARLTRNTITDPSHLRRELAKVRWQGFATCWQEDEVGFSSLAVPVRDYRGAVIASLAIAGASIGQSTQTTRESLSLLRSVAHMIGTDLRRGGVGDD